MPNTSAGDCFWRTYGDKVYTNFICLNMPEDGVECESFAIAYIDSLLGYENKYFLQIYLDNCVYKILDTQMTDYLDDYLFEPEKNSF